MIELFYERLASIKRKKNGENFLNFEEKNLEKMIMVKMLATKIHQ